MTTATLAASFTAFTSATAAAAARCCDALRCTFSPGRVYQYALRFEEARHLGLSPFETLHDWIAARAGEVALAEVQRGVPSSHGSSVRDIVLSLERVARDLRIPINGQNASRLARALCPFATSDDE